VTEMTCISPVQGGRFGPSYESPPSDLRPSVSGYFCQYPNHFLPAGPSVRCELIIKAYASETVLRLRCIAGSLQPRESLSIHLVRA
jgi:hypothetical protein